MAARRVLVLTAALLTAAGCTTGTVRGPHPPPVGAHDPTPVTTSNAPAPGVDILIDTTLWTADGVQIALPGSGMIRRVDRVPAGWIVWRGGKAEAELWLVTTTSARTLVNGVQEYAATPDGRLVAFRQQDWVTVARLEGSTLTVQKQTNVPGRDGEQGRNGAHLAGWAGRYLAFYEGLGAAVTGYDLWDPAAGDYRPTWNRDLVGMFGAAGDDLLGAVNQAGAPCLARVSPSSTGPRTGALSCGVDASPDDAHALSPDGRWLVAVGRGRSAMRLYDLTRAAPVADLPWIADAWGAAPVWVDRTTVLIPNGMRIVRVSVDDPTHATWIPLPGPVTERWQLVAAHGT